VEASIEKQSQRHDGRRSAAKSQHLTKAKMSTTGGLKITVKVSKLGRQTQDHARDQRMILIGEPVPTSPDHAP
jgi:hypothetical protein